MRPQLAPDCENGNVFRPSPPPPSMWRDTPSPSRPDHDPSHAPPFSTSPLSPCLSCLRPPRLPACLNDHRRPPPLSISSPALGPPPPLRPPPPAIRPPLSLAPPPPSAAGPSHEHPSIPRHARHNLPPALSVSSRRAPPTPSFSPRTFYLAPQLPPPPPSPPTPPHAAIPSTLSPLPPPPVKHSSSLVPQFWGFLAVVILPPVPPPPPPLPVGANLSRYRPVPPFPPPSLVLVVSVSSATSYLLLAPSPSPPPPPPASRSTFSRVFPLFFLLAYILRRGRSSPNLPPPSSSLTPPPPPPRPSPSPGPPSFECSPPKPIFVCPSLTIHLLFRALLALVRFVARFLPQRQCARLCLFSPHPPPLSTFFLPFTWRPSRRT